MFSNEYFYRRQMVKSNKLFSFFPNSGILRFSQIKHRFREVILLKKRKKVNTNKTKLKESLTSNFFLVLLVIFGIDLGLKGRKRDNISKNIFFCSRGRTIKEMLEHSVSDYDALHPDPKGWFLQISGIYKFFYISLKFVLNLGLTQRCRNKDEYFVTIFIDAQYMKIQSMFQK